MVLFAPLLIGDGEDFRATGESLGFGGDLVVDLYAEDRCTDDRCTDDVLRRCGLCLNLEGLGLELFFGLFFGEAAFLRSY